MGRTKSLIIIAIISISIAVSFFLPKIRYQGFDIIKYLSIPLSIGNWFGRVMPNTDEELKEKFTFINKSKQYYFWKKDGSEIYFSLLNAGNFHNPKNCYTGIGYKPRYEGTNNIKLAKNTTLQFDSWLMLKKNNDLLTTYWMCIDGKKVSWLELKLNELICSLTNRKSINVLTRIDVPTNPKDTDKALMLTKNFIRDLYGSLDKNKRFYLFGEKLP
jgi:hypothetical protein